MAGVLNTSTAYEQLSVICFLWSKGRTPIEIHRGMQQTYGERCLALRRVRWWSSEFENGRENLNDNERAGRPRLSVTDKNTARMGAMVKAERRVRIKDIAQELDISFGSAFNIILDFDNVIILHDNARPHVANKSVNKLRKFHWEFLEHPPYNPDLARSDFHLFSPLKKFLARQRFTCVDEVKAAVRQWFRSQTADFYCSGITKLVLRWDKCLNRHGDYVEK